MRVYTKSASAWTESIGRTDRTIRVIWRKGDIARVTVLASVFLICFPSSAIPEIQLNYTHDISLTNNSPDRNRSPRLGVYPHSVEGKHSAFRHSYLRACDWHTSLQPQLRANSHVYELVIVVSELEADIERKAADKLGWELGGEGVSVGRYIWSVKGGIVGKIGAYELNCCEVPMHSSA
jgi:hypothetical protein